MSAPKYRTKNPIPSVRGLRRIGHCHYWVQQRPSTEKGWTEDCLRCGRTRERHYFFVVGDNGER